MVFAGVVGLLVAHFSKRRWKKLGLAIAILLYVLDRKVLTPDQS
jgi:hypothetical protein